MPQAALGQWVGGHRALNWPSEGRSTAGRTVWPDLPKLNGESQDGMEVCSPWGIQQDAVRPAGPASGWGQWHEQTPGEQKSLMH